MKNFLHQRNVDLCEAAQRLIDHGAMSLDEIADKLLSTPAPAYYVSRDYAYEALLRFRRTGLAGKRPMIRQRWAAFDRDVRLFMERHRYVSLFDAVDHVASNHPAPGFFLEKASLKRMLQYMNRRSRLSAHRDLFSSARDGSKLIRHSPSRA